MKRSITKAAADKLGERLRKSEVMSEEDLPLFQKFRLDYVAPLATVEQILRDNLGLDPTSRIKTLSTILEKLRRDKTRLSTMQDIAGARVVKDMTIEEQDGVVADIAGQFATYRIDDRRTNPSYGYRAVHVIVQVFGFPVEVQVRTKTQHLWAELMEKLADRWGRQIRYGGLPNDPDRLEVGGTRRDIVATIIGSSETIARAENRPDSDELKIEREKAESELRLFFENILRGLEE